MERKLEVERCILQLGASCEEITAYMQCEKKGPRDGREKNHVGGRKSVGYIDRPKHVGLAIIPLVRP